MYLQIAYAFNYYRSIKNKHTNSTINCIIFMGCKINYLFTILSILLRQSVVAFSLILNVLIDIVKKNCIDEQFSRFFCFRNQQDG